MGQADVIIGEFLASEKFFQHIFLEKLKFSYYNGCYNPTFELGFLYDFED